jgi:hypothetical protein
MGFVTSPYPLLKKLKKKRKKKHTHTHTHTHHTVLQGQLQQMFVE